ncbi:MAG: class I SAM-dependent methyltransferase [Candidatus Pacebacteria bacterium]|nr:class I SAM-dependent methyltransferase [Candidatus Paceibacterota bacterium]MCF7863097.1 class I SAM-dependent methyltransferase [Candidatus Paceibacterota bacterium]
MIETLYSKDWEDYELLDTGDGMKLEKFGSYILSRPYDEAVWKKSMDWKNIDGVFNTSKNSKTSSLEKAGSIGKARWVLNDKVPKKWELSYKGIKFLASPTPFRHLGFFPEQAVHWDFIESKIKKEVEHRKKNGGESVKFLNLFGYTGVASIFALRAGAEVTHVDASKQTIDWAKENQKLSGLEDLPMKVICEDVMKFIEREERRGNKYDCVIMDPPKFGRGPKGEIWKIEEQLPKLLNQVQKILSEKPLFVILNSYATDSSSLALKYSLEDVMIKYNGEIRAGELCLKEKSKDRLISLSNVAIWEAK